jgi:hypothetical protein
MENKRISKNQKSLRRRVEIKVKERLENERRRNLTDEQRKEEDLRLGTDDTVKPERAN